MFRWHNRAAGGRLPGPHHRLHRHPRLSLASRSEVRTAARIIVWELDITYIKTRYYMWKLKIYIKINRFYFTWKHFLCWPYFWRRSLHPRHLHLTKKTTLQAKNVWLKFPLKHWVNTLILNLFCKWTLFDTQKRRVYKNTAFTQKLLKLDFLSKIRRFFNWIENNKHNETPRSMKKYALPKLIW